MEGLTESLGFALSVSVDEGDPVKVGEAEAEGASVALTRVGSKVKNPDGEVVVVGDDDCDGSPDGLSLAVGRALVLGAIDGGLVKVGPGVIVGTWLGGNELLGAIDDEGPTDGTGDSRISGAVGSLLKLGP